METLSNSTPIARKEYNCDASKWLLNGMDSDFFNDLTFSEKKSIALAKKHKYKILKGEKYIKQNNVCGGVIYSYRAIENIHDICINNDVFIDNEC